MIYRKLSNAACIIVMPFHRLAEETKENFSKTYSGYIPNGRVVHAVYMESQHQTTSCIELCHFKFKEDLESAHYPGWSYGIDGSK